jgi:integrase
VDALEQLVSETGWVPVMGKSSQFLFTNSAGGHVDHSNFSKKWRKAQEDLGITPRSPHNTRHTFATSVSSARLRDRDASPAVPAARRPTR